MAMNFTEIVVLDELKKWSKAVRDSFAKLNQADFTKPIIAV